MFKFCSLYSGSSGNSLFIETPETKILVDAGESAKKIEEALHSIEVNIQDINAILITHEHLDHIKGVGTLSKKFNLPIYANKETWEAMPDISQKVQIENQNLFNVNENFNVGELEILPFSIPHDATNPCGFNIYYKKQKISIATDIGHMDYNIIKNLEESCFILLEANYDPNILKCSKYPYSLKQRISGPNGHLSNEAAGKTISYLMNNGLKNVMLGHLSKESNFPELAYKTVVEQLGLKNLNNNCIKISIANRVAPSPILNLDII